MTGAIKGSSTEKLYHELGIEHLCSRRRFRKPCLFSKISKNKSPPYLFDLVPSSCRMHSTRNSDNITPFKVRHNFFKNFFFSSAINEWNKIDLEIHNSASLRIFKKHLLNFIRPYSNNVFNINDLLGLKLQACLRK